MEIADAAKFLLSLCMIPALAVALGAGKSSASGTGASGTGGRGLQQDPSSNGKLWNTQQAMVIWHTFSG